jgi:hypothetical protein
MIDELVVVARRLVLLGQEVMGSAFLFAATYGSSAELALLTAAIVIIHARSRICWKSSQIEEWRVSSATGLKNCYYGTRSEIVACVLDVTYVAFL